jgi:hypothetical protein
MMICVPCRAANHSDCTDTERYVAALNGDMPGVPPSAPTASSWCDCQHQSRAGGGG